MILKYQNPPERAHIKSFNGTCTWTWTDFEASKQSFTILKTVAHLPKFRFLGGIQNYLLYLIDCLKCRERFLKNREYFAVYGINANTQ